VRVSASFHLGHGTKVLLRSTRPAGGHARWRAATGDRHVEPSRWIACRADRRCLRCALRRGGTPIDIRSGKVEEADLPAIGFHYKQAPLKIIDNGHMF
jgi:hypothetical protein